LRRTLSRLPFMTYAVSPWKQRTKIASIMGRHQPQRLR
jgi:hypothetical protein